MSRSTSMYRALLLKKLKHRLPYLRHKLSILAFFYSLRSCLLWSLDCESLLILLARCTFVGLRVLVTIYIYICVCVCVCCNRGKNRDCTFIPTSLFRDCSLIMGFSVFSPYRSLYLALIQRIEHCKRKNQYTDFLYIYIYIYIGSLCFDFFEVQCSIRCSRARYILR